MLLLFETVKASAPTPAQQTPTPHVSHPFWWWILHAFGLI